jgi:hypothetical protein
MQCCRAAWAAARGLLLLLLRSALQRPMSMLLKQDEKEECRRHRRVPVLH